MGNELMNAAGICQMIDNDITNFIHNIIVLIKFGVPILLVILGMLDFFKAVIAGKDDEMKKSQHIFIKRLIAGVVVFFIISITQFVISIVDGSDSEIWKCASAIMNGTNQGTSAPDNEKTYDKDEDKVDKSENDVKCTSTKAKEAYDLCRQNQGEKMCNTIFQDVCAIENPIWINRQENVEDIAVEEDFDYVTCAVSDGEMELIYEKSLKSCWTETSWGINTCLYYFYPVCAYDKQGSFEQKKFDCCYEADGILDKNGECVTFSDYSEAETTGLPIIHNVNTDVYNQCINN